LARLARLAVSVDKINTGMGALLGHLRHRKRPDRPVLGFALGVKTKTSLSGRVTLGFGLGLIG